MRKLRLLSALVTGFIVAVAIARLTFGHLGDVWPDYATAEPEKAYTLAMLLARLGLAAFVTICAAITATIVAGDRGRAAGVLGLIFVAISLPSHLHYAWDDYPAWYHVVYLAFLVPIALSSAWFVRIFFPKARPLRRSA